MHALTNLADAAVLRTKPERAAQLFGAADGIAERSGASVFPVYRRLSDRCRADAIDAIGRGNFEALLQRGAALRLDAIVALATGVEP